MDIPDEAMNVFDEAWDAFRVEEARDIPGEEFPHDIRRCVDAAALAAQVELLNDLYDAFESMASIRHAAGDPAAHGIDRCVEHVLDLRKRWKAEPNG